MEHRFAVPAVTAHLSQRETYEQVLASLEALESASERVLGGIAARVESQRATLASIDARVASVNAKIAALAGTRRAITVLSLPRYPASEAGRDFRPLHHDARPLAATPADDRLRVVPRRTQAEHDAAEHEFRARRDGDAVELFRRFAALAQRREDPPRDPARLRDDDPSSSSSSSRAPRLETVARNVEKDTNGRVGAENTSFAPDDGLGAVPPGLASVSNLLLFNSATNPYARFSNLDVLAVGDDASDEERTPEGRHPRHPEHTGAYARDATLAEAPRSVLEGSAYRSVSAEGFGYKPTPGATPEMRFPSILPNLPMVADIHWNGAGAGGGGEGKGTGTGMDAPASIAPSSRFAAAPPDVGVCASSSSSSTAQSGASFATNATTPPPSPPPPPPGLTVSPPPAHSVDGAIDASPPPPRSHPSPPPTEARAALLDAIRRPGNLERLRKAAAPRPAPARPRAKATSAPVAPASDPRGDLMSAIRSRPQLKSAAAHPESAASLVRRGPDPGPGAGPGPGGGAMTMMEELANSLGRRRTAITGGGGGVDAAGDRRRDGVPGLAAFSRGRGFRGGTGSESDEWD